MIASILNEEKDQVIVVLPIPREQRSLGLILLLDGLLIASELVELYLDLGKPIIGIWMWTEASLKLRTQLDGLWDIARTSIELDETIHHIHVIGIEAQELLIHS